MTTEPVSKIRSLFDTSMIRQAVWDSFSKLSVRHQIKNPVMFVVFIGSVLTTVLFVQALIGQGEARPGFILGIALWLWFTLLFANFAEAMAEGRGKAQAQSLRKARQDMTAKKLGALQPGIEYRKASERDVSTGRRLHGCCGQFVEKG